MESLGFTKYKLAEASAARGISPTITYSYLRGERNVQARYIEIYFDILGLKVVTTTADRDPVTPRQLAAMPMSERRRTLRDLDTLRDPIMPRQRETVQAQ
jgi:hypothetical protein